MKTCIYCRTTLQSGFCCEKRELDVLRAITDEVVVYLDSEIVAAHSLGSVDAVVPIAHAASRLREARTRAA